MSEIVWTEHPFRAKPLALSDGAEARPSRWLRSAKWLLAGLTILMLAVLFAVLIFLPATGIEVVEVTGNARLEAGEILAWNVMPLEANWFSVDLAAIAAGLLRNPRLATATVDKLFPDRLVVAVTERQPVALIHVRDADNRLRPQCVDAAGVVFAPLADWEDAAAMPILSGLELRNLQYGMSLGPRFGPLLQSVDRLRREQPLLLAAISELRVVDLHEAGLELLLYPLHYPVPVRIRPILDAELVKSILLVLDVVSGRGLIPTIQELDFRTDTYVYRIKEAVSE
ncbi:MAG: hypothetical protein A2087_03065 [Spirochaetes bacterium GWD1_61_31]|nr:MAG: hypothetical protein A2Y37_14160 [Spirochaetes bacterium GWB1_60_80]OHD34716.1 MAG: hypothetical protein A2004_00090 [Spirochaetes bacterium GWC1_61_12]OHD38750.1 MAG: hypothetical protein A2087_03065 [Spirochaetes bacterium GWD1_61_31]OHD44495.1 MAG: hypothetical protein A2Y35_05000 [Spirochaetes bacterium GWE1_60_18]OHD59355.1 MAG: hypothetical protein A2Y32_08495 [Spirochaetes bacterium GWF1_60_12]HAP43145.1 hypothetical protein [Spirochaetaceae bacterium]